MNATIPRFIAIGIVAIGLVAGLAGTSHAQFILYDNFDSGVIDPVKWFGFSTEGPSGAPAAEAFASSIRADSAWLSRPTAAPRATPGRCSHGRRSA